MFFFYIDNSETTADININISETEDPHPMDAENIEEIQEEQNMDEDEDNVDEPEEEEDEDEETEETSIKTTLQVGRVKKIMKICLATNDENEIQENPKKKKSRGKGAKETAKKGPVKMILSKEAIYIATVATVLTFNPL
jgi:hypothetical protein